MQNTSIDTFNNLSIHLKKWLPESEIKGIIILIHGLGEHVERYDHVGVYFNKHNFAVYGFDLPGHGRSGGTRGHINSFESVYGYINKILDNIKKDYPATPVFLYGHSLGGLIATNYLLKTEPAISGLIASSPGLTNKIKASKFKLLMVKILSGLLPTFLIKTNLEPELISRDEEVVNNYINDPLVHDLASTRLAHESISSGQEIIKGKNKTSVPFLLIQGTNDLIVPVEANVDFAKRLEGNVTIKLWEGLYHEVHNESEKEEVLAYVHSWMCRFL